jgi:hypothetical protein
MACFDHFPILISQLVLRTYADHYTVDAEPILLLSSRTLARFCKRVIRTVQFGPDEPFVPGLSCIYRADEQSWRSAILRPRGKENTMTHGTKKPIPKLRKAPQPPLSHAGAIPDSDRAKRPPLSEPSAAGQELTPGDRVEGLGDFGKPNGEFGTVERANEEDAVVKWDDDGRMRLHQPSLKKI